jgi:hypothetical protein
VALSDEQNAMLRLLASGEQGYGDIAALMGLGEDEVRAKVVGALAQLQAEGEPVPDIPSPLAGGAAPAAKAAQPEAPPTSQAEPPGKAEPPAERAIAGPAAAQATGGSQPQQAASEATTPKAAGKPDAAKQANEETGPKSAAEPPAAEAKPAASAASPPPSGRPPSGGRTITLPAGRKAWLLGGGVLAAIAVIVVVILLVSGGGGSGSSTGASEAGSPAGEAGKTENAAGSKEATQAELKAVDGSEAAGLATFGRVKNKLALQVEATGLEPTTEGTDAYTIWLEKSPQQMLPLASTGVKSGGKGAEEIAAEFEVPVEVLSYLAKGTFDQITITRTQTKPLEAALKVAQRKKTMPAYTGEAVLSGTITGPIVGLATREEAAKKNGE